MKESHLTPPDLTEFAALGFTGNEVHILTFFLLQKVLTSSENSILY